VSKTLVLFAGLVLVGVVTGVLAITSFVKERRTRM